MTLCQLSMMLRMMMENQPCTRCNLRWRINTLLNIQVLTTRPRSLLTLWEQ